MAGSQRPTPSQSNEHRQRSRQALANFLLPFYRICDEYHAEDVQINLGDGWQRFPSGASVVGNSTSPLSAVVRLTQRVAIIVSAAIPAGTNPETVSIDQARLRCRVVEQRQAAFRDLDCKLVCGKAELSEWVAQSTAPYVRVLSHPVRVAMPRRVSVVPVGEYIEPTSTQPQVREPPHTEEPPEADNRPRRVIEF